MCTKLVPLSLRSCLIGPLRARNRRKALIKLSVVRDFVISRWIARLARHVNIQPYIFNSFRPSFMRKGPKRLTPVKVNGGESEVLSTGKSAIFCPVGGILFLRHVTHLERTRLTAELPWIIQNLSRINEST